MLLSGLTSTGFTRGTAQRVRKAMHQQRQYTTFSLSVGNSSTSGPSSTERWIELGWPDPLRRKNVQRVGYWGNRRRQPPSYDFCQQRRQLCPGTTTRPWPSEHDEMMSGDWRTWKKLRGRGKDSKKGSLGTQPGRHPNGLRHRGEPGWLKCPAQTSELGRVKGPDSI
ncbi:uncharacterized protein N7473_004320 [Penicillium subrubescens]|uniref:uncharacterized protein n=1 Tax=Penicillium subrubescens TaxID=1316194 RepID=UPI002545B821|nr:uncharacterized protein N7473_004320 [Penicillium subrubescens]KAJ5900250.1 hypothetical protein N7473_004320 [Penicillium subrubescens]